MTLPNSIKEKWKIVLNLLKWVTFNNIFSVKQVQDKNYSWSMLWKVNWLIGYFRSLNLKVLISETINLNTTIKYVYSSILKIFIIVCSGFFFTSWSISNKEFRENQHCVVPHYACTTSSFVAVLSCNEPLLSIFSAKLSVWYWLYGSTLDWLQPPPPPYAGLPQKH